MMHPEPLKKERRKQEEKKGGKKKRKERRRSRKRVPKLTQNIFSASAYEDTFSLATEFGQLSNEQCNRLTS